MSKDSTRVVTRRNFLRLAGGIATVALISGCGASGAKSTPALKSGAKATTIKELGVDYLAYPDVKGTIQFSNCWAGARIPLIETWIKEFNKYYPNVKIENDVSDCPPLREKQVTAIAGGSPPNVMMIKSDNMAFFADQKAVVALDDLMARDGIKGDWFYPSEIKSRVWAGKTYGLPNVTAGAVHLLFANTKLLQKVGWDPSKPIETWQDLESLVEPAKKAGLFVLDPAKVSTGMTCHFVLTYANGGRYWDDDISKILWNEPAGVEAAEWLLKIVKMQADKYANLALASDRKNVIEVIQWSAEKYICMFNLTARFFDLPQKAPNLQYVTYNFPRNANNSNSKGYTPSLGGWSFCIATAGKDQEAAWEWIKFTTVSKYAGDFVKAQNRPSPMVKWNEDPEVASRNRFWPVVAKDLATGIGVPAPSNQPQFYQLWLDMEDAILYEKMSPKDAVNSFAQQGESLLKEWRASRGK